MPAGTRQLAPAMWGLVPSWWHKPLKEKKFSTFNARAEGLEESNTFRGAFRHRRCLVPASGFYEWTGPQGRKTPYAIGLRNRRWFCFAGLWDRAMIDGSELDSFTILTTKPNDLMAGLHTRMPVIVDPPRFEEWLGEDVPDPSMFEPFAAGRMEAFEVSTRVNSPKNNNAALVEPVARDGLFG